jgi:hypothetical protein
MEGKMSSLKILSGLGLGALALVALVSCASVSAPPEQGIISNPSMKQDEGVVFGILNARSFDSQGKPLSQDSEPIVHFIMRFGPSSEGFVTKKLRGSFGGLFKSGGELQGNTKFPEVFFANALPAGEYSIFAVVRHAGRLSGEFMTDVRFNVVPNKATYIGSVQLEFHSARGLFGEEVAAAQLATRVLNEFDKATQQFKGRNPNIGLDITSNLAGASH